MTETPENEVFVKKTYQLYLNDGSRSSLKDLGAVWWDQGDVIKYYSADNAQIKTASIAQAGPKSELLALVAPHDSYFVAVYGGDELSSNNANSFIMKNAVPNVQDGLFCSAHKAVAYTDNVDSPSLYFQNITSLIKVIIPETLPVDKLVFSANGGEQISGDAKVSLGSNIGVEYVQGGGNSITLDITNGPGVYYFSILPCTVSGFTLKAYIGEYVWGEKIVSKTLSIKQSQILNLGNLLDINAGLSNSAGYPYMYGINTDDSGITINQKQGYTKDGNNVELEITAGIKLNAGKDYSINLKPDDGTNFVKSVTKLAASSSRWYDLYDFGFDKVSTPYEVVMGGIQWYLIPYYDRPVDGQIGYVEISSISKKGSTDNTIVLNESRSTEDLLVYDASLHFYMNIEFYTVTGLSKKKQSVPINYNCHLLYVPVKAVSLPQSSITIAKDQTIKLNYSVLPAEAYQDCVISTSDNNIVSVNSYKKTITAVSTGEATIKVTSSSDSNYSATCNVIVVENSHTSAITNATDLGASETANCYIITEPGAYKLPVVKGKSGGSAGTVGGVELLWETCNNGGDVQRNSVIASVDYDVPSNYIYFTTPASLKPGNALIAAKNVQGEILWSWHIWIPETPIDS